MKQPAKCEIFILLIKEFKIRAFYFFMKQKIDFFPYLCDTDTAIK